MFICIIIVSLSFMVVDHDMTLTIKLIDKRTGVASDEKTITITLTDPCDEAFGVNETTVPVLE